MAHDDTNDRGRRGFGRAARRVGVAWLALIVLMLASLGSAYLHWGAGNLVAGLSLAVLKSGIVVWLFMELRRASTMTRIAAVAGLTTLLVLTGLSLADYATRRVEPAPWQAPRQIEPVSPRN